MFIQGSPFILQQSGRRTTLSISRVGVDPVEDSCDPSVDPGVAGVGASISPGNYAGQGVVVAGVAATVGGMDKGSTTVTL